MEGWALATWVLNVQPEGNRHRARCGASLTSLLAQTSEAEPSL